MFVYDSINYNKNDSHQRIDNKNYVNPLVYHCKLLHEVKEETKYNVNYSNSSNVVLANCLHICHNQLDIITTKRGCIKK